MITHFPYPDIHKSLSCLHFFQLGKQRVEALRIYNLVTSVPEGMTATEYFSSAQSHKDSRWSHHPAVLMWINYPEYLATYYNACLKEWEVSRGYKNNMAPLPVSGSILVPPWMGNLDIHASHRSNLLRKQPSHYSQFGWSEPDTLPYVWPTTIRQLQGVSGLTTPHTRDRAKAKNFRSKILDLREKTKNGNDQPTDLG